MPRNALRGGDPGVEREAGVDLPAFRILRTGEAFLERRRLRGRDAAFGLRTFADEQLRIELAVLIEDHPVLRAVGGIALVKDAADDRLLVAVRPFFDLVQRRHSPLVAGPWKALAPRRRAGHDALEVGGIALGHQHGFASAGRTAREIGVIRGAAVVLRDDLFGETGDAADGLIREVERGLLLALECAVEGVRSGVACVRRDDREPANERGSRPCRLRAKWEGDAAVQSAAALLQKAAVPVVGKVDGEADAVRFAVGARAPIDDPVDAAVRRQLQRRRRSVRVGRRRTRARRLPFSFGDFERDAWQFEVRHRRACRGSRRGLRGCSENGQLENHGYLRFLLKNSSVLFHAVVAAFSSYRGVVSLWKPCCAPLYSNTDRKSVV